MTMRILSGVLIALIAVGGAAAAQDAPQDGPPIAKSTKDEGDKTFDERMAFMVGEMQESLGLSDDQAQFVKPELITLFSALANARNSGDEDRPTPPRELRKKMRGHQEAFEKALREIVTDEQWATYEEQRREIRKNARERIRERIRERGAERRDRN